MSYRYSTAITYIVLVGTGIYCLIQSRGLKIRLPHLAFTIITLNSLIGVWRWGNPTYGDKADSLFRFTSYIRLLFALPCITTSVWLGLNYELYQCWIFAVLPFITLMCHLTNSSAEDVIEETIVPINLISLGAVSYVSKNYWGVTAACSYAMNHYIIRKQLEGIPAQDLYNYGLCFFTYFALKAVGD